MTDLKHIVITPWAQRLAREIARGGEFSFADLCSELEMHRDTVNVGLATLEELGAISHSKPKLGRPTKDSKGHSTHVTIHVCSWVWEALDVSFVGLTTKSPR